MASSVKGQRRAKAGIHIGRMVQIPIKWNFVAPFMNDPRSGLLFSELKLNDELTIKCFWTGNSHANAYYLKPRCIEFRRRITATEEVSISGSVRFTGVYLFGLVAGRSQTYPEQKISGLMKPGTTSIMIEVNAKDFYFNHYSLEGVVNIENRSKNYINKNNYETLGNEECRKCAHMVELSNDLGRLLDPETCCFSDVNLKCGDASIPAHKNILSARSPVFAAMFKHPMKENRKNEVVISDIDVSALRIMLAYMYTGNISDLTVSSAPDLLLAADKYQLEDLKRTCCAFLKDNFSLENVLRILFLGELHCNDLKSCAIDYICNSCAEISVLENTEEWKSMKKVRPDLAVDILTSVVKEKETKIKQLAK